MSPSPRYCTRSRFPIRTTRPFPLVPAAFALGLILSMLSIAPAGRAHAASFTRGDADSSGRREITDAIFILNFLFNGGRAPACTPIADSNGDKQLNLSDAIFLLGHLFLGTPAPPPLTQDEINQCGGVDPAAIARGMKELEDADPDGNYFSCALCHSMAPDETAEVIRSGYTLLNSLGRPSFKLGGRASFVGAVNVCRKDWMSVLDPVKLDYVPWTENEPRFKDLVAFISSLSTADTAPALQYEIVAPAATGPSAGNADEGCRLFNRSCSVCHGIGATGTPLGKTLVDVTPLCAERPDPCLNLFCEPAPAACLDNPDHLRYRIRLSGPLSDDPVYHAPPGWQLAGSTMPFWTRDKLSDAQVEDIVAFIAAARQAARDGKTTLDCTSSPSPDGNALRRGTLTGAMRGVSGIAAELDTRRIRFSDFSYDGGGLEVRVWLFKAGAGGGRAIGPDLFGNSMSHAALVVEIPADVTPASFDSVSIRCATAGVDYGSAKLEAVP